MPGVPTEVTSEAALGYFGKIYAAWASGTFNNPETKEAACVSWSRTGDPKYTRAYVT